MRRSARAAAALVVLAACSGGGGDSADGTTSSSTTTTTDGDGTTTTESATGPVSVDVADQPEGGFFFTEFVFGDAAGTGEVVDPTTYRTVQKAEGYRFEQIVAGNVSFTRQGDEPTLASIPFVRGERRDVSAEAALESIETQGADVPVEELIFEASLEAAQLRPDEYVRTLLDADAEVDRQGDRVVVTGPVPLSRVAEQAASQADVEPPQIAARAQLDGDGVVLEIDLNVSSFGSVLPVRIEFAYDGTPSIDTPTPDQIDATPNVAEEALRAFTDTPIVAFSQVPSGFELAFADLLPPSQTLEDCTQVSLGFESTTAEDDYIQLFVLPRSCAEAFDPAPYDDTFGGFPSRVEATTEVLVGDSVVQLDSSLDDDVLELLATTLAPMPADQLIALVAPG